MSYDVKHPMRSVPGDLKWAALIGSILVLPLVILEFLNQPFTNQNVPGVMALFAFLWLMAVAFVLVLAPLVRNLRAGNSMIAQPLDLLLRIAILSLIAWLWSAAVVDQMPCFLGVPNCD